MPGPATNYTPPCQLESAAAPGRYWKLLSRIALLAGASATLWAQAPAQPPVVDRAASYYHYGLAHMYAQKAIEAQGRGEFVDRAIAEYKAAIAADPQTPLLVDELSDFYISTNRLNEARSEAEAAIRDNPNDLAAHRLLARIFVRQISDRQNQRVDTNMLRRAIEEYETVTRLDSTDIDAWVLLGRLQRIAQDNAEAERAFQGALAIDPNNEDALTSLAALRLEQGDNAAAAALFKRVSDANPTAASLQRLAGTYEEMQEWALAAETIKQALNYNPANVDELRTALARDLLNAGMLEEAAATFEDIAAADPANAEPLLTLAQIYGELGQFDQAREAIDKARAIDPNNIDVQFADVQILQGEQKPLEAVARLREIVDSTAQPTYGRVELANRVLLLERLALMHRTIDQTDEAVAVYRDILILNPERAALITGEIIATLRAGKRFDDAEQEVESALAKWPQDRAIRLAKASLDADLDRIDQAARDIRELLDGSDDRAMYLMLAEIYEKDRRFEQVAQNLDQAEDLSIADDEKFAVYFMRGAMYERMKNIPSAEAEFRKALELFPGNPNVLNYLGYMLADGNQRLPEALELIEMAIDQEPNNGAYIDSLGWVYYRMGRYAEAEEQMRRAVVLTPLDPTMHDHFADVLVQRSKLNEAVSAYEESLRQWQTSAPVERDPAAIQEVQAKLDQARRQLNQ